MPWVIIYILNRSQKVQSQSLHRQVTQQWGIHPNSVRDDKNESWALGGFLHCYLFIITIIASNDGEKS